MTPLALVVFVLWCYDGDTCTVEVPGWHPIVGEAIPVRFAGIDAPEIRGKCEREKAHAKLVQKIVESKLQAAKRVELKEIERGKYFRLVAKVYADGRDVGADLLKRGLVREYDGAGPRESWCPEVDPYKDAPSPAAPQSYRPRGGSLVGESTKHKAD